jgi:hypothetical protein
MRDMRSVPFIGFCLVARSGNLVDMSLLCSFADLGTLGVSIAFSRCSAGEIAP